MARKNAVEKTQPAPPEGQAAPPQAAKPKARARPQRRTHVAPVARHRAYEPMEHKIGQDRPRDLPTDGQAALDPPEIETVEGPRWKDRAAEEAFMNEPVKVVVHEAQDQNGRPAHPVIDLWCNGRSQFFIRGRPQVVRRKFVEVLARAKDTSFTQEHYRDLHGNDAIRNIPRTSHRYPFAMLEDRNPKGRAWLQKVCAEA